ncbi:leucine-rich repeat-containing protein 40 [Drosophila tropicalis]|uniref:leucine-rich repeat-containing protein 40 n=1 Tax=Drosophila tropicalis TaxID=46794 RepID=UPI0035AB7C6C
MVGDGLNSPRQQGGKSNEPKDGPLQPPFPDKYSMRNTRILSVPRAQLRQVPAEVFEIARQEFVNTVNLEGNKFVAVPMDLQKLNELLTELNFAKNQLAHIPTFISQFSRMDRVNLSCNLLRELPMEFAGLQLLSHLNISHNRFDSLPLCIYELENLETLQANDNQIESINVSENGLGALKRLNELDLSNNDIRYLPPQLGNLTNIHHLKLSGNPFRQPRHQILAMGTAEVMSYLRGRIPT